MANAFELPDRTLVRDSTAVKACRRTRKVVTTVRGKAVHANLTSSSSGSVATGVVVSLAGGRAGGSAKWGCGLAVSAAKGHWRTKSALRIETAIHSKKEADFQAWWRACRDKAMKP